MWQILRAMCSPVDPVLANLFMCYFEEKWVITGSTSPRPSIWIRYSDDTFDSKDTALIFYNTSTAATEALISPSRSQKINETSFVDILV